MFKTKKAYKRLTAWLVVFACGAILAGGGCEKTSPSPSPTVRIRGQSWVVELAMTEKQRHRGLSGREQLEAGSGMLFVYPRAKKLTFCMRGCEIPIDIVFIGPDRRIINVYEMRVEPDGLGMAKYESHLLALYALELPGGSTASAGVIVGDIVEFTDIPQPSQAEQGD